MKISVLARWKDIYVVTVRDKYGQLGNNKEDWVGFQGE